MKKPKITITLVDQKGTQGCHRGHRKLPSQPDGSIRFCCPDVDVINVFKIQVEEGTE